MLDHLQVDRKTLVVISRGRSPPMTRQGGIHSTCLHCGVLLPGGRPRRAEVAGAVYPIGVSLLMSKSGEDVDRIGISGRSKCNSLPPICHQDSSEGFSKWVGLFVSLVFSVSGRPGSNRQPSAWKAEVVEVGLSDRLRINYSTHTQTGDLFAWSCLRRVQFLASGSGSSNPSDGRTEPNKKEWIATCPGSSLVALEIGRLLILSCKSNEFSTRRAGVEPATF